ncbi:MAG: hypothetical protein AAGF36_03765 [Pseudomonadota bacterium]
MTPSKTDAPTRLAARVVPTCVGRDRVIGVRALSGTGHLFLIDSMCL